MMHISDPHAADQEVRQIDSPSSSADENDAIASLPAHWSESGYVVSPCNVIAIDLGGTMKNFILGYALVIWASHCKGFSWPVTDCCRRTHVDER